MVEKVACSTTTIKRHIRVLVTSKIDNTFYTFNITSDFIEVNVVDNLTIYTSDHLTLFTLLCSVESNV